MTVLLHHFLTDTAVKCPGVEAVAGGGLTYGQIESRSNRLARLLVEQGAGSGIPIAMCVEKSPDALVAIFAILKSGSCYVPIDLAAPVDRTARILADAEPACVVADARGAVLASSALEGVLTPCPVVRIDQPARTSVTSEVLWGPEVFDDAPLSDGRLDAEDPAYILYTSGSTGSPKGVVLSHRAAVSFVEYCQEAFSVERTDRVSSHAPLHFDLSVFDVFATVAAGATMVPVTGNALVFPRTLAELIERERISVWYSVPFALVQLVRHGDMSKFPYADLRTVLFAGERMPVAPLRELMEAWSRARFFNLYGPTETNVVTVHEVDRADLGPMTELPIGKPWPGSRIRVVDSQLRERTDGTAGELCVSGRTSMSGYWRDPEASSRAFVDLPVQPGGRTEPFYRTGDMVRRDVEGTIWFLGRRDDMVKIRGHRVELGEVESALVSCPGVAEAAAVTLGAEADIELAAVATADGTVPAPDSTALMAHLASRLPPYMLPRILEVRKVLPRTSTGKLDRRRLAREIEAARP